MAKRGNPNWNNPQRMNIVSSEQCEWEGFLEKLGVRESDVMAILPEPTTVAEKIKFWVQANFRTRYCPSKVLRSLGIRPE